MNSARLDLSRFAKPQHGEPSHGPTTFHAHPAQCLRRSIHCRSRSAGAAGCAADVDPYVSRQSYDDSMGPADLRFDVDRFGDHGRAARRSVRQAALLHLRLPAVCAELRVLRRLPVGRTNHFFSRAPSGRRRDDFRQRPCGGHDRLTGKPTWQSDGRDLHGLSYRFSHRPDSRWLHDRQHRLALDLFHQSTGRHLGRLSRLEIIGRKSHGFQSIFPARFC
jgi:hypothetical protein